MPAFLVPWLGPRPMGPGHGRLQRMDERGRLRGGREQEAGQLSAAGLLEKRRGQPLVVVVVSRVGPIFEFTPSL